MSFVNHCIPEILIFLSTIVLVDNLVCVLRSFWTIAKECTDLKPCFPFFAKKNRKTFVPRILLVYLHIQSCYSFLPRKCVLEKRRLRIFFSLILQDHNNCWNWECYFKSHPTPNMTSLFVFITLSTTNSTGWGEGLSLHKMLIEPPGLITF